MKNCEQCNVEFHAKRADAKYCSPKCRKDASRGVSEENVKLETKVEEVFEFKTPNKRSPDGFNEDTPRTAKYWYDVPLAAIPELKENWPEFPNFMDGRQYFLWWKNNFKEDEGTPIILNPHKVYDKLEYVKAGQGSRHWGA